ncbi:MAG: serine/threonine-protein kinase, partial [Deltaproteobacteria bacterium]
MYERLCADLVQRWHRGERVPVEAYLRQHPELESGGCAFELILTEVILRQEYGEAAPLDEYLWRFPRFEERLRRHFMLHSGLAAAAPSTARGTAVAPPARPVAAEGLPAVPGYEIVERIGRGGMGIVYKARDASLGRYVALKVLRDDHARAPDKLARFLREARTASALNHPGICTVHALCEHDGRPFIVMELIEGLTLRALVARRPQPDEVARLIGQVALALAAAHAAGVVHRDIKPENIMARSDGHVKVVDFGLARLLPAPFPGGRPAGNDSGTDPGITAGTLTYMSPEQTRSEPASSASDVFSLGIVAYELATGRHPFPAASALETFSAIAAQAPLAPRHFAPALSADLEALMLQMLDKDPHLRPTAAEIGAILGRETRARMSFPVAEALDVPGRKTVGRDVEREALWAAFEEADRGNAVLLCVSGEPGIGKTTLVEEWLRELRASARVAGIGRGRCSERLAGTGSYLPVLEALEGLLRGETGSLAARMMRDLAPTWYAQVAPRHGNSSADALAGRAGTATVERMKREFLAFVAEIGRQLSLIFFFDDLHWADASTLDLLAWLGRHLAGLRLMVVTTHRPAEMHSGRNPFVPVQLELQRHGVCRELPLAFLTSDDVE